MYSGVYVKPSLFYSVMLYTENTLSYKRVNATDSVTINTTNFLLLLWYQSAELETQLSIFV